MKKKEYVTPEIFCCVLRAEGLLITASPGISDGEFDPDNDEIGAKPAYEFEDDEEDGIIYDTTTTLF
jgi:hypothetical protein